MIEQHWPSCAGTSEFSRFGVLPELASWLLSKTRPQRPQQLAFGPIEPLPPLDADPTPIEPEAKPSRDFRITASHRIGQGGPHEKARDNTAAIRLLKALEAETRDAMDDEKAVLARYVGWGAIPAVFERWQPEEWRGTARDVKELLTDAEYDSARTSTPNPHHTSPMVIEAMWNSLNHIGVRKGALILEPWAWGISSSTCWKLRKCGHKQAHAWDIDRQMIDAPLNVGHWNRRVEPQ